MAFTMTMTGNLGVTRALYNVDWAVGYGAPCHQVDTMLVQALLHIFYYEQGAVYREGMETSSHTPMPPPPGYSSIAIDGYIGPATQAHIDSFQEGLRTLGWIKNVDHRFDPMREVPYGLSTIQKEHYALFKLNQSCNNSDVIYGSSFFRDLRWREDMPISLRSALKTEKKRAAQYSGGGAQSSPAVKMAGGGGSAAYKQA
ncbi:peptidoglycan-binding protein [Ottowia caeni]|uniref:peptidoglycan-binding protein n=1 Tax=Ottowia caeni TaxID=2870339 RepID=UPI001E587C2F|nr:peptidoglycan-binding protein [Ottowia caeni]